MDTEETMKPTYRPEDIAFRARVSDAAAKFIASNQTMPTHAIISGDLFKAMSYAVDELMVGEIKVCGLKVGIKDVAPVDTLDIVCVLPRGKRR